MKIYNAQGQPIILGNEIGRGGEGKVFAVETQPDVVAKVYDRAVDAEKTAKLSLMVTQGTEPLLRLAAWPTGTLHDKPNGNLVGFLMAKVSGHQPIHSLYGPKDRLRNFPQADWRFLIHTAANLAAAFEIVHQHGHVIGDVNHGNVVVSQQAMVKLIDCDSFQIKAQDRWFPCEVGVSTHTPPELQTKSLREVERTANHDDFGLAVLIFQLLFMGRHPFSGKFLGAGEMSLERAIQESRFAYSPQARQMEPPPNTLSLAASSEPLAELFERAFSADAATGARPAPQEWAGALNNLSSRLIKCGRHSGHHFLKTLNDCPWCAIEARTGVLLFPLQSVRAAAGGKFNLSAVWAQIRAVPTPDPEPKFSVPQVEPSAAASQLQRRARINLGLMALFLIGSFVGLWFLKLGACIKVGLVIPILYVALRIVASGVYDVRKQWEVQLSEAKAKAESLARAWEKDAGNGKFLARRRELEQLKIEYEKLPAQRRQKLMQLEKERHSRQLQRFLDSFLIRDAVISGIGPTRKTTLQSYGIETAADISQQAVLAVSGFGRAYTAKLVEWRQSLEKQFVFDPTKPIDPADIAQIEQEISATRQRLEQELLRGATQLQQLRLQIHTRREAMFPAVQAAVTAMAQLETDLKSY